MDWNANFAEVIGGSCLLTINYHVLLLSIVIGAEVLSFYVLLEMHEVFCAAARWEVAHNDWHSFHVVDC